MTTDQERQDLAHREFAVLNKLAKWRSVFTGWQLGTRPKGEPEADAVRNHREVTILLRAEVSALAGLLIERGVFTQEEWSEKLIEEATALDKMFAERFPGIESTDFGIAVVDPAKAAETMRGWRP